MKLLRNIVILIITIAAIVFGYDYALAADNVDLTPGAGATVAFDDVGGVHHQRFKVQYGVDGSATDVSDSNPMPIDDAGGALTVDGTVTANLGATDNAVLDSIDSDTTDIKTAVEIIDNTVSGSEMQVDIVSGAVDLGATDNAVLDSIDLDLTNILGDTDTIQGDTTSIQTAIENLEATEGSALGSGVLLQGDDGTDRTNVLVDTDGHLQVDMVGITTATRFSGTENNATAQTNNAIVSAAGASTCNCITDIVVSNGATAGEVKIVEDTGGTPVDIFETIYVGINGGAVINLSTPICGTANKDIGYTTTTVTTHTVTVAGFEEAC